MEHSIDMAEGRVPFGHDGFQDRFQKASQSLRIMNFAENVAYNMNAANPAESAVN